MVTMTATSGSIIHTATLTLGIQEQQKHGKKGNTMMKTRFTLCLVLLSSLLMARDQTNDIATDASKLIALENAWNQAQLHHDAKALNDLVSDTLVYRDYHGTVMNRVSIPQILTLFIPAIAGKGRTLPMPPVRQTGRAEGGGCCEC